MRKANVRDTFNFARFIKELDIKALKDDIFNAQKGKKANQIDIERVGFDMILDILDKAVEKNVEERLYEVLSAPFEMTPDDVGDLEIVPLLEALKFCFDYETLLNFIKRVGK